MYLPLHVLLRKTLKLNWTKSSEKIPHSLSAYNCNVIVCIVWGEDNSNQVFAKKKAHLVENHQQMLNKTVKYKNEKSTLLKNDQLSQ